MGEKIPISEFRELGLLQEANRQFFHPIGLALEVNTGFKDRKELQEWLAERGVQFGEHACDTIWTFISLMQMDRPFLSGVWDYRTDDEGMVFGDPLSEAAVEYVDQLVEHHREAREAIFGNVIQPANEAGIEQARAALMDEPTSGGWRRSNFVIPDDEEIVIPKGGQEYHWPKQRQPDPDEHRIWTPTDQRWIALAVVAGILRPGDRVILATKTAVQITDPVRAGFEQAGRHDD